jgi:cytochrome c-type biogenesis protein
LIRGLKETSQTKMDYMGFMESMGSSNIPLIAAFFIGLMNAASPCTVATNITAIAYVSRRVESSKATILVGFLYTLGRMFTYTLLASLIVYVGLNEQSISLPLQEYGGILIGPFMILCGLIMLETIKLDFIKMPQSSERLKKKLADHGYVGAFLLGAVFALAFCPFSAILYFGMLMPLAIQTKDAIFAPIVFSFATGLPVIILSFILAFSIKKVGEIMHKIQVIELWTRRISAAVFIIAGIYYLLQLFGIIT